MSCSAKRDAYGYSCRPCGASWVQYATPPECIRSQLPRTDPPPCQHRSKCSCAYVCEASQSGLTRAGFASWDAGTT